MCTVWVRALGSFGYVTTTLSPAGWLGLSRGAAMLVCIASYALVCYAVLLSHTLLACPLSL